MARAGVHVPVFRPVAARFLGGYAVATTVILTSFAATGSARVTLFALAVVLDIATLYFTVGQQSALPRLSTSKSRNGSGCDDDRAGRVRGRSDRRVVRAGGSRRAGRAGHRGWRARAGHRLWWIYFHFVAWRAPKPVFVTALFWVYLHLATLTAITATGVSAAIADTATGSLADPSRYLLVGSVVLGLVGIAALQTTLARADDEPTHPRLSPGLKLGWPR